MFSDFPSDYKELVYSAPANIDWSLFIRPENVDPNFDPNVVLDFRRPSPPTPSPPTTRTRSRSPGLFRIPPEEEDEEEDQWLEYSQLAAKKNKKETSQNRWLPLESLNVNGGGRNGRKGGRFGNAANLSDKHCTYCFKKGGKTEYYTHSLRDKNNQLTCPELLKVTCALCGATGQKAHTMKYCPLKAVRSSTASGSSSQAME